MEQTLPQGGARALARHPIGREVWLLLGKPCAQRLTLQRREDRLRVTVARRAPEITGRMNMQGAPRNRNYKEELWKAGSVKPVWGL